MATFYFSVAQPTCWTMLSGVTRFSKEREEYETVRWVAYKNSPSSGELSKIPGVITLLSNMFLTNFSWSEKVSSALVADSTLSIFDIVRTMMVDPLFWISFVLFCFMKELIALSHNTSSFQTFQMTFQSMLYSKYSHCRVALTETEFVHGVGKFHSNFSQCNKWFKIE